MTILLFLAVLVVLILVHEAGHFIVAKWSGMRVDEFGVGFPPRLYAKKIGETEYSINALPFGGFVRIYGENGEAENGSRGRAFTDKPRLTQAAVLIAGVTMNMLLAWVLLSTTLFLGMPRTLSGEEALNAGHTDLMVAGVLPDSPAAEAEFRPGDRILFVSSDTHYFDATHAEAFTEFISGLSEGTALSIGVERADGTYETLSAAPAKNISPTHPENPALGVSVSTVGVVPVSWYEAPIKGLVTTWNVTAQTAQGLIAFLAGVLTFSADLSSVAGPVGIAGAVGDASANGVLALLSLSAIISINLALINVLPLPALDGGRLLFVIIEGIIRRPVHPRISQAVNMAGFAFLLLIMAVVTASDILKLF